MNDNDLPITLEDREPDSFDTILWWTFVVLSALGTLVMIVALLTAASWLLRRWA